MVKDKKSYMFDEWFMLSIPEVWEYEIDEDILNVYSNENPEGAIQISFFHNKDEERDLKRMAEKHLNSFIKQSEISVDKGDCNMIEDTESVTFSVSGTFSDGDFVKSWVMVDLKRLLIITYISERKTKELKIAEDIVSSIKFDNSI